MANRTPVLQFDDMSLDTRALDDSSVELVTSQAASHRTGTPSLPLFSTTPSSDVSGLTGGTNWVKCWGSPLQGSWVILWWRNQW
jgi:hypothetical protein